MINGNVTFLLAYLLLFSWACFAYVIANYYVPCDYVQELLKEVRIYETQTEDSRRQESI